MSSARQIGSLLAVAATALVPATVAAVAQDRPAEAAAQIAGDWRGALKLPQGEIPIGIHLKQASGALTGTFDIPTYQVIAVPLASVSLTGGRLSFDLGQGNGQYSGSWDAARKAWVGTFTRQGNSLPLEFGRGAVPQPAPVDWNAPMTPGFVYTPATAARARTGPTLAVGKCMNMSNMLDAKPNEGSWGAKIAEDDFRIIKAAGFTTVRIPVRWSEHADAQPPYSIDPAFLKRVHHVVDLATAAGLNAMLNMHHYEEMMAAPEAHRARFTALWRQIAASFASAPESVWFELLNEPTDKLTDANLPSVLEPALAAVRATNPKRAVVIGGQNWSNLQSLDTLKLPDDPYVVPTFHYYDPFMFTHQGASWIAGGGPPFGRSFGSSADKAALDNQLAGLRAYMTRSGRVPVLGEFGATEDPRLPVEQRARYYRTVSSAFASLGVQSCVWGYRSGFKIRDGDKWIPGLVESVATTR
jgi:endoglucanase